MGDKVWIVSDSEKAEIKRLHAEGMSLRKIAEEIDRSPGTIGKIAKELGLEFDTRPTAKATAAKQQDNRARRVALAEWQYGRAMRLALRLDAAQFKTTSRSQTGAITDILDYVPADDELALSRALNQYAKTAADLEKIDAGDGAGGAKSMLTELMAKLRSTE